MTEIAKEAEHERVEMLLPWFVNGTVDESERALIKCHLDDCAACKTAVAELRVLQEGVQQNPATPIVPEPNVGKLLASIDDEARLRNRWQRGWGGWAIAATIGALAVAMLGYLIGSWNSSVPPVRYETATSVGAAEPMDYVLHVGFQDGLSEAERLQILQGLDAKTVTQTGSGARIVVQLPAGSLQELEEYTRGIGALQGIRSVDVVAVQLPVRQDP